MSSGVGRERPAAAGPTMASPRIDPWLLVVLGVSLALCADHLRWGLPHGNESWAADAIGPLTVLNVGMRQLGEWNSGWFWFKYPFGYPLVLLGAYAPYLGYLLLTGQLSNPSAEYPYGLSDPETALFHLALAGRLVNVAFIVGTVALTYGIARRLFDRRSGLLAAWFAATAYPLVYYAHTTNQDAAYLFWLTLALWATVGCVQDGARRWYWNLGIAAGMAMATKEQGFALLLALPVVLIAGGYAQTSPAQPWWRRILAVAWNRGTRGGLALALFTWAAAGNAFLNPTGFLLRLRDLSGTPVPGLSSRVTPVEFSLFKGFVKEWAYLTEFIDVMSSSLSIPVFVLGIAGIAYAVGWRRRAALCLVLPLVFYYLLSLRTHHVLTLRYTLPVLPILASTAAALCVAGLRRRPGVVAVAVGLLCAFGLARSVEVNALMRYDPRYAAEDWMQAEVAAGSAVEVYQKPVYLPRLGGFRAVEVPMPERTVAGLRERAPDVIVLSSASRKTIHQFWAPDWRAAGGELLTEVPAASEMLAAIESGRVPYREAARFERRPWLIRIRITSLAPQIRVFVRDDEAANAQGAVGS